MLDEIYFFFNLSYFGLFVVEFARRPRPEFLPKSRLGIWDQNFDVRPKEKHPLEYTIIMKFGKFLQQQVPPEFKEDPVFAGFYSSMIRIASRISSTHSHSKETEERHDAAIDEVTSYHKSLPWHFVVQHGSNSQNDELMTQVLKQENLRA